MNESTAFRVMEIGLFGDVGMHRSGNQRDQSAAHSLRATIAVAVSTVILARIYRLRRT